MARMIVFTIFLAVLSTVRTDYPCLCSFGVNVPIYERPDKNSTHIGLLYDFDCKTSYRMDGLKGFEAVGYNNKLGYIESNADLQTTQCAGNVPEYEQVTGTFLPPTTTPVTSIPATATTRTTTTTKRPRTTLRPITTTTTPRPTTTTTAFKTTTLSRPTTLKTFTSTATTTSTTTRTTATTPRPTTTTTTTSTTTTTTPMPTTTTTTTTKPTTTRYISRCPSTVTSRTKLSYIYKHRSYCYEFRDQVQDWYHAKQDCQSHGGFLMSIQSQDEQDFIYTMLNRLGQSQPVWLGLYDEAHEEVWQWVSGMPLIYTNWMPGRYHDKYHSFQNCGLYVPLRHGEWDDIHCRGLLLSVPATHPWICQYHLV